MGEKLGFGKRLCLDRALLAGLGELLYQHRGPGEVDKFTCIAGGPKPLPGKSPIESFSSLSSSSLVPSTACVVGKGGSLAMRALIAERRRLDMAMEMQFGFKSEFQARGLISSKQGYLILSRLLYNEVQRLHPPDTQRLWINPLSMSIIERVVDNETKSLLNPG
jgi:hypothetical protein